MKISGRDYRGIERFDIELNQIALIAGRNEAGKSCVLEAARAALCGMAIPIVGVLKKDAKLLVRDGAERGHAHVEYDDGGTAQVEWPSTSVKGDCDPPMQCTDYASGLLHLLDQPVAGRAQALRTYINSDPTQEEVEAAAKDAGYQDGAIAKIWAGVRDDWDATYRRARAYTVKLKGQWQEVTGEKYGAKKGADWGSVESTDREALVESANTAEQTVLDTAGAVAVSDVEIERLNRDIEAAKETENRMALNDELNPVRDKLKEFQDERDAIPDEVDDFGPAIENAPCPDCGSVLTVAATAPLVLASYSPEPEVKPDKAKIQERKELRETLDEVIAKHTLDIAALEGRITTASNLIAAADAAKKRLKDIAKAPKLDEVAIQKAKDEFSHAQDMVRAFDAKARADKLHGDLAKNEKLIAVLAPDGLRRRKLATKLGEFNARLATICASAAWPVVRLDEKLEGHYGTRPVWAASKSGQWRARTVLQIALTQIDGSAAVLLDEADMLDKRGRNGLFKALVESGLRSLVCMTFSKRDQVPNLAKAGLGRSYWIEGGKAEAIA